MIGGRLVNRLGPGEGFGEIALLRDVPRTATVTTTEPSELFALDRETFLDAVSSDTRSYRRGERDGQPPPRSDVGNGLACVGQSRTMR